RRALPRLKWKPHADASPQHRLAHHECFGVTLRRPALHSPQTSKPAKRSGLEPVFRALRPEMLREQFDLALERCGGQRHVVTGPAWIAVPFGNLVLKDEMVAKRIPGQLGNLAMVLMGIIQPVRKDHVRTDTRLQLLQQLLDLPALVGKETILESRHFDRLTV